MSAATSDVSRNRFQTATSAMQPRNGWFAPDVFVAQPIMNGSAPVCQTCGRSHGAPEELLFSQ